MISREYQKHPKDCRNKKEKALEYARTEKALETANVTRCVVVVSNKWRRY